MKTYGKIVLAGGSGQMGKAITTYFKDKAEEIVILSRSGESKDKRVRTVYWNGKDAGDWCEELEGADLLVNLAGKNVNCRYTEKNKREIFDSRTDSIRALSEGLRRCKVVPKVWIQSASATIYRHAEDHPMNEVSGEIGEGFSVEVCKTWESTFLEMSSAFPEMRKVILRTSLVLGEQEGVFPRLKNLIRFGLGGSQGNGKQWVSWVHETDVAAMVEWILEHREIEGVINCTAPVPLKNTEFMSVLRKQYGAWFGLPAPTWLLELGAILIGTETELILKSRWVLPDKIRESGYEFKFPQLEGAIKDILNGKRV